MEFQKHPPAATASDRYRICDPYPIWNRVIVPVAVKRFLVRTNVRHDASPSRSGRDTVRLTMPIDAMITATMERTIRRTSMAALMAVPFEIGESPLEQPR